ncbi:MAG: WG repeat-containing protein [Cyanobacteria bacterium HKST-UBA02]|nr:WG repeat-containing protein [Cyanobacteria bacterium HKST-UBA02]
MTGTRAMASILAVFTLISISGPALCKTYELPGFFEDGVESEASKVIFHKKLWGFIDKTGKFAIEPRYNEAGNFLAGGPARVVEEGQEFYIGIDGKKAAAPEVNKADATCPSPIKGRKGEVVVATAGDALEFRPLSEDLAAVAFKQDQLSVLGIEDKKAATDKEPADSTLSYKRHLPAPGQWLWGFVDNNGSLIIEPRYDTVSSFVEGLAAVLMDRHFGYIDKEGKLAIKCKYLDARDFSEGFAEVKEETGTWGFVGKNGKLIASGYQETKPFKEGLAAVKKSGRWGFINTEGKPAINIQYDRVLSFQDGLSFTQTGDRACFIDPSEKKVINGPFLDGGSFYQGLAPVLVELTDEQKLALLEAQREWDLGYLDRQGLMMIKPQFVSARPFSEGLAACQKGLRWGYIDFKGNFLVEPIYEDARPFSEGLGAVKVDGKWGYLERTGKMMIKPRFSDPGRFSDGLAFVLEGATGYYIDRAGQKAFTYGNNDIPRGARPYTCGYALVPVGDRFAFLGKTGNVRAEDLMPGTCSYSEDIAAVGFPDEKGGKPRFGFIDLTGDTIIKAQYDRTRPFGLGLGGVLQDGKWGFVDRNGRLAIPLRYDSVRSFSDYLCAVKTNGKWGFIDNRGDATITCSFDDARSFKEQFAAVRQGDRWHFVDRIGRNTFKKDFFLCGDFSNGKALIVVPRSPDTRVKVKAYEEE